MKTKDLEYYLPEELIAQRPADARSSSRLLVLDKRNGTLDDRLFSDIGDYLRPEDCLVLNDTKVLSARFFAKRETGASLEGLYLGQAGENAWHIMLRNARKVKPGEKILLLDRDKEVYMKALACHRMGDGSWFIEPETDRPAEEVLEKIGYAPLPPYISRPGGGDNPEMDRKRYQTVFAKKEGAVAAPTAGLHFTEQMLSSLEEKGIQMARVTLHVGAGTFKPVIASDLSRHEIHSEKYTVSEEAAEKINTAKENGGRIIAVGTTSVRTLETAAAGGKLEACSGETRLFIVPGVKFNIVDAMITNFHLPRSTLLALVGAFAGMDKIMTAYKHAVEKRYRFFSYGDAMFIY
ncbi:tRNA preQ1(34) S-adenosylmethionine ribosyltransferase-isomerase QueA [Sedimentisphaera salicampi]|uniref:tRNA preQ1(34) S-adenosylmethionine ribosyltransferase-isomerase QueA n=1 Tax=Sedimentisphaera salicampi TaxID=1941349 RepID=UPI000B9BA8D4|nr:tRNA preQ1(34) S-adenosylmethionine ribosyltransferase-isomerase QueA [Sedimentisphaera salicampi]OXU14793.1 S-adenosylmethionine:tRNA ribosyltransferase-isomerase [Sedimentisphaera salicampi]